MSIQPAGKNPSDLLSSGAQVLNPSGEDTFAFWAIGLGLIVSLGYNLYQWSSQEPPDQNISSSKTLYNFKDRDFSFSTSGLSSEEDELLTVQNNERFSTRSLFTSSKQGSSSSQQTRESPSSKRASSQDGLKTPNQSKNRKQIYFLGNYSNNNLTSSSKI